MDKEFLKNLKVGDKVGVKEDNPRIDYIKKITKTMIILQKLGRYNKETGRSVGGDGWHTTWIVEPTDEFLRDYHIIRHKNLIRHYIKEGYLNKLKLDQLELIYNTLKGK